MPRPRVKKIARLAFVIAAATAALWFGGSYGWFWWREGRFQEATDNAYVRADVTLVASRIAGYVASVEVEDNQPVSAGQVLFRIDDADYKARVRTGSARTLTLAAPRSMSRKPSRSSSAL